MASWPQWPTIHVSSMDKYALDIYALEFYNETVIVLHNIYIFSHRSVHLRKHWVDQSDIILPFRLQLVVLYDCIILLLVNELYIWSQQCPFQNSYHTFPMVSYRCVVSRLHLRSVAKTSNVVFICNHYALIWFKDTKLIIKHEWQYIIQIR